MCGLGCGGLGTGGQGHPGVSRWLGLVAHGECEA